MRYTISLNNNRDFKRVYRKGKSDVTPFLVVYSLKNNLKVNRMGITVNKKTGNAVLRNRAKRVIREAFRHIEKDLIEGYDFVLVARAKTPFIKSSRVEEALKSVLKKRGFLK